MKKNILLVSLIIFLSSSNLFSQWVSPGNNSSYTLDELVAVSGGVVTLEAGTYHFNAALTLSESDTINIFNDGLLIIHENILWTVEGVLIIDPPSLFQIQKPTDENNFQGIRFDNSSASNINKVMMTGCGGVKLVDSDLEIKNCDFSYFGQEYTTAAVDLFHSNPLIRDCSFISNAGPAIASGANGESSPQIINNILSFNVTSNSNTPQINLGTSDGLQAILIDSNHVYGQYDMAGGIAISNLVGGSASVVVTNNDITLNRYGIAMIGTNITSVISHNSIVQNDIQGDPMLGGSGINFYGDETNISTVSYNHISRNLWGVTIQLNAQPNLGDDSGLSPGHNIIILNENSFQIYGLYNNTPGDIMALNNFWG
ncbi:MAG: hypothetical protein GQ527_09985, partial [Bacteroidales bacterium]|nr:hypothetical protein [Bacteroidales bacterium]